jgi:uncharacterized membrane protein YcaP (DUF421 family)
MWTITVPYLEIAVRVLIIYVAVLIGIRLTGKREVGQMSPFDLVLLLLLANAVQNAMTGPDTSVIGGLVAAAVLLVVNALVTKIVQRNRKVRKLIEGTPTMLIYNGVLLRGNIEREEITAEDISQALREHGVFAIADVYLATLEIDGSISVIKTDERPTGSLPHHRIRFARKGSG